MNKNIIILFGVIVLTCISSCNIDIPLENEISEPDAITDYYSAKMALSAAYQSFEMPQKALYLSAMTDDFDKTNQLDNSRDLKDLYNWRVDKIWLFSDEIWKASYNSILSVNTVLYNIDQFYNKSTIEEKEKLDELIKEAKTLKALNYLYLLKIYGEKKLDGKGIPIENSRDLTYEKRSTVKQVADHIKSLLSFVKKGEIYSNNGEVASLNLNAAVCIIADLELWLGNYSEAASWAEPLLDASKLEYSRDIYGLWLSTDRKDVIFSYDLKVYDTSEYFYASMGFMQNQDYFYLNDQIKYSNQDYRYGKYSVPVGESIPHFYLGKFNQLRKEASKVVNFSIFRMANLYFIAAEANAKMSNNEKALSILNQFLQGCNDTPINESRDLLNKILEEKRKEFAGEGERFFDMKRNNIDIVGRSVSSYQWNFPIPLSEIIPNPNMVQNNGW